MRYSQTPRFEISQASSVDELLATITGNSKAADRQGGVLLVGGNTYRDIVVRQAQAEVRLDRLPSFWSHAALIVDWPDGADSHSVIGVEAALEPADLGLQVPERNGVTLFRLGRYLEQQRYPNLLFGTLCDVNKADLKAHVIQAALQPNRDRLRYRFWEWLGVWAGYTFNPATLPNPIVQGIPLPGAALCEYAYEAAGLDLTPGATAPNACPELLWNTLLYWHDRLGSTLGRVAAWGMWQREAAPSRQPLSIDLEVEGRPAADVHPAPLTG